MAYDDDLAGLRATPPHAARPRAAPPMGRACRKRRQGRGCRKRRQAKRQLQRGRARDTCVEISSTEDEHNDDKQLAERIRALQGRISKLAKATRHTPKGRTRNDTPMGRTPGASTPMGSASSSASPAAAPRSKAKPVARTDPRRERQVQELWRLQGEAERMWLERGLALFWARGGTPIDGACAPRERICGAC